MPLSKPINPKRMAFMLRYARMLPAVVCSLCMLLTVLSILAVRQSERRAFAEEVQAVATDATNQIERRITTYVALLNSGAAFFEMSDDLDVERLRRFVGTLDLETTYRGAEGIGWATVVKPGMEPDILSAIRRIDENARLWPEGGSRDATRTAIMFVEPMTARNRAALGFDMASEDSRHDAMQTAVRTGSVAATAPVRLVQEIDEDRQMGFLIYVPVFERPVAGLSPAERQAALQGYIYSPFRAGNFLSSALRLPKFENYHLSIFDNEARNSPPLFEIGEEQDDAISLTDEATIANRRWTVRISAPHDRPGLSPVAITVFALGTLVSILAGIATLLMVRRFQLISAALEVMNEQEAIRGVLTRELTHRVKNTLATVLSLASLTRRNATDVDDYVQRFTARLRALSATQDILTNADWKLARLSEVIKAELAPFLVTKDDRVHIVGPEVALTPNVAMSVGLAVHELATNAAKYGALSVGDGQLDIGWTIREDSKAVQLRWKESGGPPVARPERRGFGSDLVEKVVARELKTEIEIDFQPDGVACNLEIPISGNAPIPDSPETA